MIPYSIGVIGSYIFCDGLASLYTYTHGDKANGQRWLTDHSFRLFRSLLGVVLIIIGGRLTKLGWRNR